MITLRAEDFTKEDFQKLRELFHVNDTAQEFSFSTPVVTQNKTEHENTVDVWKAAVKRLTNSFPNSFVNQNLEFIVDKKTNNYFRLEDCKTELDIKCKVLEWLSRAACYATPYRRDRLNKEYQDNLRGYINGYLGTDFTREEMEDIYEKLGNGYDHALTVEFIESGYRMEVLREKENESHYDREDF